MGVTPTPRRRSTTAPLSAPLGPSLTDAVTGRLVGRGGGREAPRTLTSGPVDVSPEDVSPEDHLLAAELATRAGLRLLALREEGHPADELRTLGDTESNRYLVAALEASRPDDGLLSEESIDDLKRLARRRVWIVDPLDGTREFGEAGRTDFAVHVALAVDGVATVGAVALPGRDLLLSTARAGPRCPTGIRPGPCASW